MLRFAPSPTGDMHIDTLRVAIVNYLVAKQRNEPFVIRIADSDKSRNIEGKDTEIMQILEKFAIMHDQVHHESEHLHMHQTLAIRLLEEGKAFVCTCQETEGENRPCSGKCMTLDESEYSRLKESGEPFVIRIKKPDEEIIYQDLLHCRITVSPDNIDSFVILGSDKNPSPLFAAACDDMLSSVNFIIEGNDRFDETAKQIHIKQMLGYAEETQFAHLPAILNSKGKKLDNNEETASLTWLFKEGFIPDAIINYLLLLGYEDAPKEIFTLPEAVEWFKLENISTAPALFDIEKLRAVNRAHLNMMDERTLSTLFGFADADIGKLAKVYLEEDACTVKELEAYIRPIFSPKKMDNSWGTQMQMMQKIIFDAPMINTYDAFISYMMKESKLEGEAFSTPLRLLLTGTHKGPDLGKIYPYIKSYLLEVAS